MGHELVLGALPEPSALLWDARLESNAAWRAKGLPEEPDAARAAFVHGRSPGDEFDTTWGRATLSRYGQDAWLLRIAHDSRSILEGSDYRAVFEVATDGIFVYDERYQLVDLNPAACAAHGWTRDEMLAMDPTLFIHPDSHAVFREFVETLARNTRFHGYARGLRRDGSDFEVEVNGVPIVIGGKRHSLGSIRDISHLREATRVVERSQARMRRALAASGAAYWEIDLESGQVFSSDGCAALFGEEIRSMDHWLGLGDPADSASLRAAWAEHVAGQSPRVRARRRLGEGATERWVEESAFVCERDDEGNPRVVSGSAIDVSERTQMERRVGQSQRLESLGAMAGGIAHDFNNLLTVMLSGAELAALDVPPGSAAADDLAVVIDAAERARRLVAQLLTFSRQQASTRSQLLVSDEIVAARPVLERLLGDSVTLSTAFEEGLWPVRMDPAQFEQLLLNLATNAHAAMPEGGRFVLEADNVLLGRSFAEAHPGVTEGSYVRLCVSDTGQGMSREVRERVFEPFFTTKPRGRGTGLGLATVYGVVQQNGGHIAIYSELGHGTTFRIYLPRDVESGAPAPAPAAHAATELDGTERVLVVDDDPDVRAVASASLARRGYRVVAAASASEALAAFEGEEPFDLVISDLVLAGSDGRVLCEQLRAKRPGLPVLLISGYTDNAIGLRELRGGLGFISKPFTPDELASALRGVLSFRAEPGE